MTRRKDASVVSDPMITRYEFTLELKISDPAKIATNELQNRVLDAIQAYDTRNRLLTGSRRADGISCLVGLALELQRTEREPDRWAEPFDDQKLREKYPFREACQEECNKAVEVSVAIDAEIERLREVQAELWRRHDSTSHAADRRTFNAELRKLRRLVERLRPIQSKMKSEPSASPKPPAGNVDV